MKLAIDYERCAGHGRCYTLIPVLFTDDERGFGHVRNDGVVPRNLMAEAHRGVRVCPERAIKLIEDV